MKRAYIGLVFSAIWLLLGLASILANFNVETTLGQNALIWPGVLLYSITGSLTHGLLWDSAHGPPFLTVSGVLIFYLVPAVWGLVNFARWRARHGRPAA